MSSERDLRQELELKDGTLPADAEHFWFIQGDHVYQGVYLGAVCHEGQQFVLDGAGTMCRAENVFCTREYAYRVLKAKLEQKIPHLKFELKEAKQAMEVLQRRMADNARAT